MKAGFRAPSSAAASMTPMGRILCRCQQALPYAGTAVLFAFILHEIPFAKVFAAFRQAPALTFIALFLPCSILYFLLDVVSLTWIVRRFDVPVKMRAILPIRASMYLVTMINTNLGQGGIAYYLHRKLGIGFMEACSSVLFLLVIDGYTLFLFSTLALLVYAPHSSAPLEVLAVVRPVYVASWVILIILGVLFSAAHSRRRLHQWIESTRIGPLAKTFVEARLLDYLTIFAIRVPGLIAYYTVEFLALKAFGVHIPILKLAAFLPIVFLANALPLAVGHLGTTQAAWYFLFSNNATPAKVVAFSLAAHFVFMSCHALIGICFLREALRDLTPHWQAGIALCEASDTGGSPVPIGDRIATATPDPGVAAESD